MMRQNFVSLCVVAGISALLTQPAFATSDEEELMRKSGCFRCHAVDKEKKGPPYKETADEYRGQDVMDKLYEHLTTEPMVEVEGKQKEHKKLKTDDPNEINAVIKWILAL